MLIVTARRTGRRRRRINIIIQSEKKRPSGDNINTVFENIKNCLKLISFIKSG